MTAVKLAEQASRAGVNCVPVFWLATEDHDLAEVNHVGIPGQDGGLQILSVPTQGIPDAPVGTVTFGPEIEAVVEKAAELLGNSEVSTVVREAYRAGETFGSAFGRLFAHLFADWGVILLDAADAGLHQLAEPIYRAAIERVAELDKRLLGRGKELEAAGYHQQVKVTPPRPCSSRYIVVPVFQFIATPTVRQPVCHWRGEARAARVIASDRR